MALKVAKPKAQPKLTVTVNNGGMQPSGSASSNAAQVAQPTRAPQQTANPQGSTYNPQAAAQAVAIQRAAVTAKLQAAVEAARIQAAAVAAQVRSKVQGQVDSKVADNKTSFKLAVASPTFQARLGFAKPQAAIKIAQPFRTADQKFEDAEYSKAYKEALADFDKRRQPGKQNILQKGWDKISGGQDRRDISAREYAEAQAAKISSTKFKPYENKVNSYNKKLAEAQAAANRAAETMTQKQFDAYIAKQQKLLDAEYKALVKEGARYTAQQTAYGDFSQKALTSTGARGAAKVGGALKTIFSDANPVWKYSLGNGDKNIPSLIKAPARAYNWVGNINTKDRTVFLEGGKNTNRVGSDLNAWQMTQNQRTANQKPWIDVKPGKQADAILGQQVRSLIAARKETSKGVKNYDKRRLDYNHVMEELLRPYNRQHRDWNSAIEVGADPANWLPAATGKLGATKLGSKLKVFAAAKTSKPTGFVQGVTNKLKQTSAVKWLGAEAKTPSQVLADTKTAVRDLSREQQQALLAKVETLTKKMGDNPIYDLSGITDLSMLNAKELEVLQRMSGDGTKFSFRDRLLLNGRNGKDARARIQSIAQKYSDFAAREFDADKIKKSSYGRGTKKMYSPRTVWTDDLSKYNFRMRRRKGIQSGDDFLHGVTDRFFKSKLDDVMVGEGKNHDRLQRQLSNVWTDYSKSFDDAKTTVSQAEKRFRRDTTTIPGWLRNKRGARDEMSLGRATFNTARSTAALPTKVWKKAVLALRPAWYVNNELYNTQAAVLAGGSRALVEKVKMISPRYRFNALNDLPAGVRSNIANEAGKGRLGRFATKQEDWSRIAAFKAAKRSYGLTDEQALKRVNRYLFDYKTANWERPIKTAMPFWSFQKNLAKAAVQMPFDRPTAAIGYNRLDQYQQTQFDREFEKTVPELTKLGYSEDEIQAMKKENAKYFKGRLKIGDRWYTTPFNANSEKGLTNAGINPWISAAQEISTSTDQFGRVIGGKEAGFWRRFSSKFPQMELGRQLKQTFDLKRGTLRPETNYIGKPGHEGFGLGKTKQGYDPNKSNYVASMDPSNKLGRNALAFAGVPSSMQFDTQSFIKTKKLAKLTGEYFKLDTKGQTFDQAEAQRLALFDKFGVTPDDFYKGVLAKYDSDNTKRIKDDKETAKIANKKLFDEYSAQPFGSRGAWARKKIADLTKAGYFDSNPDLYSFVKTSKNEKGWLTPDSIRKIELGQQKKGDYEHAISTGDWSGWAKKYGVKSEKARLVQSALKTGDWSAYEKRYGRTDKAKARDAALASGNWTDYAKTYGVSKKTTPHQLDGKFFKSAESMEKYKKGKFWEKYTDASPEERKKLLAANPQYNDRANWTAEMWLADKKTRKAAQKKAALGLSSISTSFVENKAAVATKVIKFNSSRNKRVKKVAWKLS